MLSPENKFFASPELLTGLDLEQKRLQSLTELGLLEAESVPIFEEATQMAAHFLEMPICSLGLLDQDREWLKSAVGLSRLGLMNELAASRQIPRPESFGQRVVETLQVVSVDDTLNDPVFANNPLVQRYRIRAYLGVPLFDSNRNCLGTLSVMDLVPRTFTFKDIEFLELTARWSMSEFERNRLQKGAVGLASATVSPLKAIAPLESNPSLVGTTVEPVPSHPVKVELLSQLTQELRTPLTSVMGMASVLNREIYGPLTNKQKEYLDIIYQSGQYLLSLVNEIVELGSLDDSSDTLNLSSVDIEMLCQQAINTLEQAANRREQKIRLSIEPGSRIWLLDKMKVRQMLYHLVFGVIQASTAGSIVRLHVSRKQNRHNSSVLNISVWVSHPWLGETLPHTELYTYAPSTSLGSLNGGGELYAPMAGDWEHEVMEGWTTPDTSTLAAAKVSEVVETAPIRGARENLGLMLSRQLAEVHGGQISIQGSSETGYRYVISLPQLEGTETP